MTTITKDYYQVLEVAPWANQTAIDTAYRHLALLYHPDLNYQQDTLLQMQLVNEAYSVLRHPLRREKYDREELAILRLILYHGARKKVFNVTNSEYTALAVQTTLKGLEVPLFWKKRELNIEERLNGILEVLFNGILKK